MNFPKLLEWITALALIFLKSSVGFGGSCFQKDILNLVYLCKHYGLEEVAEYWYNIIKINDYQKNRFAQKIINHFGGDLTGKKIAILGWAFKKSTNDSRESSSIFVSEDLYKNGAELCIYDPIIQEDQIINDIKNYWKLNLIDFDRIKIEKKLEQNNYDAISIMTSWNNAFDIHNISSKIFDSLGIIEKSTYSIGKIL